MSRNGTAPQKIEPQSDLSPFLVVYSRMNKWHLTAGEIKNEFAFFKCDCCGESYAGPMHSALEFVPGETPDKNEVQEWDVCLNCLYEIAGIEKEE
jgi:hypothetical protein